MMLDNLHCCSGMPQAQIWRKKKRIIYLDASGCSFRSAEETQVRQVFLSGVPGPDIGIACKVRETAVSPHCHRMEPGHHQRIVIQLVFVL